MERWKVGSFLVLGEEETVRRGGGLRKKKQPGVGDLFVCSVLSRLGVAAAATVSSSAAAAAAVAVAPGR